jgi:hypothetical protein
MSAIGRVRASESQRLLKGCYGSVAAFHITLILEKYQLPFGVAISTDRRKIAQNPLTGNFPARSGRSDRLKHAIYLDGQIKYECLRWFLLTSAYIDH